MTVEKISVYDSKRMRIDTDEESFLLYRQELKRLRLEEGSVLDKETKEQIYTEILIPRARKRVLYYLKSCGRSEGQIRQKLRQGLYPERAAEAAVAFLKEHGLLDDAGLARDMVEARKGTKSRRELGVLLMKKGFDRETAEQSLEGLESEDEVSAAGRLLEKNRYDLSQENGRRKAYACLLRHGFSYETATKALKGFLTEENFPGD